MTLRAFSYGGGVQSTAALVLAAQGRIDYRLFIFANVGDDSENPATLRYLERIARPFALEHELELVEVQTGRAGGSLHQLVTGPVKTIGIPAYGPKGGRMFRTCTADFKIRPITQELKRRGATPEEPAISGLGISLDEYQRARSPDASGIPWQRLEYPLLELRLTRDDCRRIIAAAGLPIPPKSSCYFCPYHRKPEWQTMKQHEPETFAAAVAFDRRVQEKGRELLGGPAHLHRDGPLEEIIPDQIELMLEDDDNCESGYCHT